MGVVSLLAHALCVSSSGASQLIGSAMVIFVAAFGYEWTRMYAPALTRVKHAYFDEANVLETYQPRARTHGHLFQPDPPTPGPGDGNSHVKFSDGTDAPERTESERAQFDAIRKQHYQNEFEMAQRLAKERQDVANPEENAADGAGAANNVETAKEKSATYQNLTAYAVPPSPAPGNNAKSPSVRTAVDTSSVRTAREKSQRK